MNVDISQIKDIEFILEMIDQGEPLAYDLKKISAKLQKKKVLQIEILEDTNSISFQTHWKRRYARYLYGFSSDNI